MNTEAISLRDLLVTELFNDEVKSIVDIADGKALVIDFWTTKCVRCPAALSKLNDEAATRQDVVFCSCVLDNKDIAADVVDGEWENMIHLFVDVDTKERLKDQFKFSQVPFCIVADDKLKVVASGNPKEINLASALMSRSAPPNEIPVTADGKLILDDDF